MNAKLKTALILTCAALVAAPLSAAIESIKVEPTFVPQLCPQMAMEGVTEAKLVVAIAVDAQGQLEETLVLGYTHPAFVPMALDALKDWKFTPAKVDGRPIGAQTELTINYNAEGVVVSRGSLIDIDRLMQDRFGVRFLKAPHAARELDRIPTLLQNGAPKYAQQAFDEGVKGEVAVTFYIDETGAVRMPSVNVGSDPYLAHSALEAVRNWKFEPPLRRGHPVLVEARQTFRFGS